MIVRIETENQPNKKQQQIVPNTATVDAEKNKQTIIPYSKKNTVTKSFKYRDMIPLVSF